MTTPAFATRLLRCARGAFAIETALVAPLLALMSIGTFEVGTMVSRQQEQQSAASEAESIILAAAGGTGTDSDVIEEVIETSMGLAANQVTLEQRFRCGSTAGAPVEDATDCEIEPVYRYVRLEMSDSYTPVWANFGVGSSFDYNVQRTIMVN